MNEDFDDDGTQDEELYRYPGTKAVLHLDEPTGTLTAEQTAFVLGNDPEFITELMLSDEAQVEQWTADALAARQGDPDPLLVEASNGKGGLDESCLHEARAWSMSAQAKREALAFLVAHPRPIVECPVVDEMAVVQELAERLAELRRACDAERQAWPHRCEHHGPELDRREAAQGAAVDAMRQTMERKLAELAARLQSGEMRKNVG